MKSDFFDVFLFSHSINHPRTLPFSRFSPPQVVEQNDFQCGRGLISSLEHRNLLPVMLEEDSWQYKASFDGEMGRFSSWDFSEILWDFMGFPWDFSQLFNS